MVFGAVARRGADRPAPADAFGGAVLPLGLRSMLFGAVFFRPAAAPLRVARPAVVARVRAALFFAAPLRLAARLRPAVFFLAALERLAAFLAPARPRLA